MALTDSNRDAIASKKIAGKAHTQQNFAVTEEGIASNVTIASSTIFAENINPIPATSGLTALYATDGVVEKVRFDLEIIPDTQIGTNQSQGYRLKLPTSYTTSGALKAIYPGGTRLHTALGKLQIVPSIYGTLKSDGSTEYDPVLYQTNGTTVITKFDSIDWVLDTYNGIVFIQDPAAAYDLSASRPGFLEAYLYVGEYLDTKISGISLSGSSQPAGPTNSVQFNNNSELSGKTEFTFIPSANTVTIGSRTGLNGQLGLSVGTNNSLTGNRAVVFGDNNSVSGQNAFASGSDNSASGAQSFAINKNTSASGVGSFAGGVGVSSRKVQSTGIGSFNFSTTDSLQGVAHGANADYSIILGGINNSIDGGNTGAVVLGGNSLKLTGSSYQYTTAVMKLAVFGNVSGGTNDDVILTLNPLTKFVRSRSFSEFSLALSAAKGPTNSIQYNLGSGIVSGDTLFLFEPNSKSLTLGSRSGIYGTRSFTQGNSTEAGGAFSVALNDNTTANGQASFASGSNTSAEGDFAHAEGFNSYAIGQASHVEGISNTAEGVASHAEGENTHALGYASHASGLGNVDKLLRAVGTASFVHSFNSASQTAGHGADAHYSVILGGKDNHIEAGNTGATIISGNAIKLTGATYSYYTVLDNLAIWSAPTFGSTGDTVLVYNQATKKVRTVPQQFIGSGSTAIITASNGLYKSNFDIRLGGLVTGDTLLIGGGLYSLTFGNAASAFKNFTIYTNSGTTITAKELKYNSFIESGITSNQFETFSGYTTFTNKKFQTANHLQYVNTGDTTTISYYRSSINTNPNTAYDVHLKKEDYAQVSGTPSINKVSKLEIGTDQILLGRYNNLQARYSELDLNSTEVRLRFSGTSFVYLDLTTVSDGSSGTSGVIQTNNPLLIGAGHTVKVGTGNALITGSDVVVTGTTLHGIIASGEKIRVTGNGATALGRGTRASGSFSFIGGYYSPSSANTDKAPQAKGTGAFGFYTTTTGQTDNFGANAEASAILGGYNHNIASGNTGAAIVGGRNISLTGTTYSGFTAVEKLAIWTTPSTGASGDTVLVWNPTTRKVRGVAQSTLQGTGGGSIFYTGASPSNTTVGGLTAGSVLTGKTISKLLETMLVVYQSPSFSTFSITGQSTTIEVGTALSGSKTFTWSTSNSSNIATNSVLVRDVTANNVLASGLANDGTEVVAIGTITNTSPISRSWRAEATQANNPAGNSTFISSNFTVNSIYPYFYGKTASGGAASGANRPTATAAFVTGGTKVLASSTDTISISFNSTSDDYIWFAIPSTSTSKTAWYVDTLNNGSIGGSVSPGGNLFPTFDSVSVTTVLWAGVSYKVYISNYQTTAISMEMRNS